MDASGEVVVDAMVYGSQQSNSSGNGTIASPEIATLEGDQGQGGCIVVVPGAAGGAGTSRGRFPDGADADSNCTDFLLQTATTLSARLRPPAATNIKVASVAGFVAGQTIMIDTGANLETAVIATVGTAGATTVGTATSAGATVIPVASAMGFSAGQTITIDSGASQETAVVVSTTRGGRFGPAGGPARSATITVVRAAHASRTRPVRRCPAPASPSPTALTQGACQRGAGRRPRAHARRAQPVLQGAAMKGPRRDALQRRSSPSPACVRVLRATPTSAARRKRATAATARSG